MSHQQSMCFPTSFFHAPWGFDRDLVRKFSAIAENAFTRVGLLVDQMRVVCTREELPSFGDSAGAVLAKEGPLISLQGGRGTIRARDLRSKMDFRYTRLMYFPKAPSTKVS